jgi:hypothetical protein
VKLELEDNETYETDGRNLLNEKHHCGRVSSHLWPFLLRRAQSLAKEDATKAAQAAEFEEWFLQNADPAGLLTYWSASPEVSGGQVVALYLHPNRDFDNPREPTEEEWEKLGLDPEESLGCVEEHPEGSDRGGYVPTLDNGCYYNEGAGEWQG